MVGTFQPLVENQKIVKPDGTPTEYFIRFIQQKQEDIGVAVSVTEATSIAQGLIDSWASARDINAGTGLDGGGNLSADVTIDLADTAVTPGTYGDATNVPQITVDQQGRITSAVDVPISGGGGGGSIYNAEPIDKPVIASYTAVNAGTSSATDGVNALIYTPQAQITFAGIRNDLSGRQFYALPTSGPIYSLNERQHYGDFISLWVLSAKFQQRTYLFSRHSVRSHCGRRTEHISDIYRNSIRICYRCRQPDFAIQFD